MRNGFLVLYTALALLANAAVAEEHAETITPVGDAPAMMTDPDRDIIIGDEKDLIFRDAEDNVIINGDVVNVDDEAVVVEVDLAAREALRTGDMQKLVFSDAPGDPVNAVFLDEYDEEVSLEEFRGDVVLLNFWATWCMPCREEMPSLDRLEAQFGDYDFSVVPVATGRNSIAAIENFFDESGLEDLPILRDPKQVFARKMAVIGLPVSVILDCHGREIARLIGEADWTAPEAKAMVALLMSECADYEE